MVTDPVAVHREGGGADGAQRGDAHTPHGGVRHPRGTHVRGHHHEQGDQQPILQVTHIPN